MGFLGLALNRGPFDRKQFSFDRKQFSFDRHRGGIGVPLQTAPLRGALSHEKALNYGLFRSFGAGL